MTYLQYCRFCDRAVEYGQSRSCTVVRTKRGLQIVDRNDRLTWTLRWVGAHARGYIRLGSHRDPAQGPHPSFRLCTGATAIDRVEDVLDVDVREHMGLEILLDA